VRDLILPHVAEVEVWLGFELRGTWARLTAPIHWAIYAAAGLAFARDRDWVWCAAIPWSIYIAFSHLIWNMTSPNGGGLVVGLFHLALFLVPTALLVVLRGLRTRIRAAREDAPG
jgi:hypothetical protein